MYAMLSLLKNLLALPLELLRAHTTLVKDGPILCVNC